MEITSLGEITTPYIPISIASGVRVEEDLGIEVQSSNLAPDKYQKIYTDLPLAKTAQLVTAERVHYLCYCCGRLIWVDESRRITTGRNDKGEEIQKITIQHSLCRQCRQDYLGWEE